MQHRTETVKVGEKWQGKCACGWVGRVWEEKRTANADADEHTLCLARAEKD